MRKTSKHTKPEAQLFVGINDLTQLLGCGTMTARRIAAKAGAEIHIGKRVLFSVERLRTWAAENMEG